MDTHPDELPYRLQQAPVERDDIDQEAALYELTHPGKKANRNFIMRRLSLQDPASIYHGDITSIAIPIISGPSVNLAALDQLIEWASTQSSEIQDVIYEFLDDPSDEALRETMSFLLSEGILQRVERAETSPHAGSFIQALLRLFKARTGSPVAMEELAKWARQIHQSKRPEAALRQALRRLTTQGIITQSGTSYIYEEK